MFSISDVDVFANGDYVKLDTTERRKVDDIDLELEVSSNEINFVNVVGGFLALDGKKMGISVANGMSLAFKMYALMKATGKIDKIGFVKFSNIDGKYYIVCLYDIFDKSLLKRNKNKNAFIINIADLDDSGFVVL